MFLKYIIVFSFVSHIRCFPQVHESNVPKVIVDADPGADDAMGIMLLLSKSSKVNVLAITCVNGNTGVVNASINALKALAVAHRNDIPVYLGSKHGLSDYKPSDNYFGADGLGNFEFKKQLNHKLLMPEHSAEALVKLVKKNPGEITLICLGPLTNVALAIHLYPAFLMKLKKIIFLGGSYQGDGNVTPGVEFNMYCDPESASLVFSKASSEFPITVVPMETVKKAAISTAWRKNVLGAVKSPAVAFLNNAERIALMDKKNWLVYDPLAVMTFLQPEIILDSMKKKVLIETEGKYLKGAMVVDYKSRSNNSLIITNVDKAQLKQHLVSYLESSG